MVVTIPPAVLQSAEAGRSGPRSASTIAWLSTLVRSGCDESVLAPLINLVSGSLVSARIPTRYAFGVGNIPFSTMPGQWFLIMTVCDS